VEQAKAIADGVKTQTRQPVVSAKVLPSNKLFAMWDRKLMPCQPGDYLWVAERHLRIPISRGGRVEDVIPLREVASKQQYDELLAKGWYPIGSIYMRREQASLFVQALDVYAQPLQAITPEDCLAEAVHRMSCWRWGPVPEQRPLPAVVAQRLREAFRETWDRAITNGRTDTDGILWHDNPWVWVIEFRLASREEANQNAKT
jgi:hypothetical protein